MYHLYAYKKPTDPRLRDLMNVSFSIDELEQRTQNNFYLWRGLQAKGGNKTMDDYLNGYQMVKITIEEV